MTRTAKVVVAALAVLVLAWISVELFDEDHQSDGAPCNPRMQRKPAPRQNGSPHGDSGEERVTLPKPNGTQTTKPRENTSGYVAGIVIDSAGRGQPSAVVSAECIFVHGPIFDRLASGKTIATTKTDHLGEFRIAVRPGQEFRVGAELGNHRSSPVTARSGDTELALVLETPRRVVFLAHDDADQALLGFSVRLLRGLPPTHYWTQESEGGRVEAILLPGPAIAYIYHPECTALRDQFNIVEGIGPQVVECRLTRGAGAIRGRVVDQAGTPIPGAEVGDVHHLRRRARTDQSGTFALIGYEDGQKATLSMRAPGYEPYFEEVTSKPGVLQFSLQPTQMVAIVIEDSNGNALEGVRVSVIADVRAKARNGIFMDPNRYAHRFTWRSTTDKRGRCEYDNWIRDALYRVIAEESSYARSVAVMTAPLTRVRLQRESVIRISLRDSDGDAFQGHAGRVRLDPLDLPRTLPEHAFTGAVDRSGKCTIRGVPKGNYRATVITENARIREDVFVSSKTVEQSITIPAWKIRIRVRDSNDRPLPRARVVLRRDSSSYERRSNFKGVCVFQVPMGTYECWTGPNEHVNNLRRVDGQFTPREEAFRIVCSRKEKKK